MWTIARILVRHGLSVAGYALRDRVRHTAARRGDVGAVELRSALEELGPTFVKLGQVLSSRADLLPDGYRRELACLRDHLVPVPATVVVAEVEAALGVPRREVFTSFSHEPLATASIGQVHRAMLLDGRRVAVKVRRPGIADSIEADLEFLHRVASIVVRSSARARHYDLVDLVEHFADMLRAELDYRVEARNGTRIHQAFRHDPQVTTPSVVPELCRESVLVMDLIEGIPLSDQRALDEGFVDRHALATTVLDANLRMILGHDQFHADPHPGNLFALPGNRLGIVDFGEVGTSEPATRAALIKLLVSLAAGDDRGLADSVLSICNATRPIDRNALGADLLRLLAPLSAGKLRTVRLGSLLNSLLSVLRKHGLFASADLALLLKAIVACESTVIELEPDYRLTEMLAPFRLTS
jgi:ubiquinone biosynthesis protein